MEQGRGQLALDVHAVVDERAHGEAQVLEVVVHRQQAGVLEAYSDKNHASAA